MYYGTPPIVTNGLVFYADANNPQSIPLDPTVNNIRSQSGSMGPVYANSATMSVSWSAQDLSWYVTFETGSDTTYYKGLWCTLDRNSPFIVLEPTSSQVVFSFKAQAITGSISMSVDLNNAPYSGSSVSNDNRSQEAIFSAPFLVTTSSVSSIYATYTVQTGSANFTGSYYYTFNNIHAANGFLITQRTTVRIWDIQHELSNYQTPFTATSRSIWYDLSGNSNHAQLIGNARPIPKYNSLNQRVLNFDGTGSYAILPATTFNSAPVTVSLTFKRPGIAGNYLFMWDHINGGGGGRSQRVNDVGIQIYGTNNVINSITSQALTDALSVTNRWTNLTYTVTGSLVNVYINGNPIITNFSMSSPLNSVSGAPLYIGKVDSGTTSYFTTGSFQSVLIYNRVLSQNEVSQNYNATKTRYGLT